MPQILISKTTSSSSSSSSYPLSVSLAKSEMALSLTNSFLHGLTCPKIVRTNKVCGVKNYSPAAAITCRKKEIHPQFYEDSKVYCNGELVMTTGGTLKEYSVDVWSGNHPFYLGNRSANMIVDDQVEKFRKKYGVDMEIPVLKGEIILPPKRKSSKGKKK